MTKLPRYRGWRFVHPDLGFGEEKGLTLGPSGGIAMVEDNDDIRQAIYMLVSTKPGERVMLPDYGCELFRLFFSPNDDTTAGLAIHYLRRALDRWEPRIDVLRIDANRNDEKPEQLNIILVYTVRHTQQQGELQLSMTLSGGVNQ